MNQWMTISACLGVLALGACATTEGQTRQDLVNAGEVTGVNEDGERVRCERIRPTGSRMAQRYCFTEQRWAEIEEEARTAAQDMETSRRAEPLRPPMAFED